jgi:hypothetical protein
MSTLLYRLEKSLYFYLAANHLKVAKCKGLDATAERNGVDCLNNVKNFYRES